MMRTKWIWTIFSICLAVALIAMIWLTRTVLHLGQSRKEAQNQAILEENVRLAMWRMESLLAPLIAQESARPYFHYTAFYPTERAYTRMYAEIEPGEVLIPSPLLTFQSSNILIHFQLDPENRFTSPQVPLSNMRDLAESRYTTHDKINKFEHHLVELQSQFEPDQLRTALPPIQTTSVSSELVEQVSPREQQVESQERQLFLNTREWIFRAQNQQAIAIDNKGINQVVESTNIGEGILKAIWVQDSLILAKRILINNREYIQGSQLNWPHLRNDLLQTISPLLPNAELEPVVSIQKNDHGRMLAALPIRLIPGSLPAMPQDNFSPISMALIIAWCSVFAAALAVALLLAGVISLSKRRGAFVSAVTHELRTPLTTFRMYTEMLADGMVQEAEKRQHYFETLQKEADRLGHLVENVLAYARLESGKVNSRKETLPIEELLERVKPRLMERTAEANIDLIFTIDESCFVNVDPDAVEQILFNLIDNACKYAVPADQPRIDVQSTNNQNHVFISVRDYGPGIPSNELRRLFRPFSKSDRDKANSAPGVGLGLALSRRLARGMGGNLHFKAHDKTGAHFVLTLQRENKNAG